MLARLTICFSVCVQVCARACLSVCVCVYVCEFAFVFKLELSVCVCVCAHAYLRIYVGARMRTCVCECAGAHVRTCTFVCAVFPLACPYDPESVEQGYKKRLLLFNRHWISAAVFTSSRQSRRLTSGARA